MAASLDISYSAPLFTTAGTLIAGDLVVLDSSGAGYLKATAANMAARSGSICEGVVISGGTYPGAVTFQASGRINSTITGLGAGTQSLVRRSSAGRLERAAHDVTSEFLGECDTDGNVMMTRLSANMASISGITVQNAGANISNTNTASVTMNFTGSGVTAADAGSNAASITIPGTIPIQYAGSNVTSTPHRTLNFTGGWVNATNQGSNVANIAVPAAITSGTYASRPAAGTAGHLYFCTDGHCVFYDNGSGWETWLEGHKLTKPPTANTWTWGVQNTAALSDGQDSLLLTVPASNGQCHFYKALANASNYTLTWNYTRTIGAGDDTGGIMLRSTGGVIWCGFFNSAGDIYVAVQKLTDALAFVGNYTFPGGGTVVKYDASTRMSRIWMRFRDDATNRYIEFSMDGKNWYLLFQSTRTDYITPTHWGFMGGSNAGISRVEFHSIAET